MNRTIRRLAVDRSWCVVLVLGLLLGVGPAWAAPSDDDGVQPGATQPRAARPRAAQARGARSAATRPTRATTEPLSAEAIGKALKQMQDEKASLAQIAHIDLTSSLAEAPAEFSLFGGAEMTHYSVIRRIQQAADDPSLAGVLVTLGSSEMEMAQAQEIRDALAAIAAKGKPVVVYADSYTTSTYVLATGGTDICLLSGGEIVMPGVAVEAMFARGLLDKLGIQADYIQIGDYKGAAESMTRTSASPQLQGEMQSLVDALYTQIVQDIGSRRHIAEKEVKALIDQAIIQAEAARTARLVDHVTDIDSLRDLLATKVGGKVHLISDYGKKKREELDLSSPFALFQLLAKKPAASSEPAVGLIYVDGMIVQGEGEESLLGGAVASDGTIRKAMRIALRDPDIKAIVIRIDSPGGSALASEAAWQAIRRVAKEKPVVISVGHMAASGGYYIACAGDRIFADSSAIVGSIGVVGGKLSLGGLYEKLGITTQTFSQGANAGIFSSSEPFSNSQKVMMRNMMVQTYRQFQDRVLVTRKDRIPNLEDVCQGRIFVGRRAVELGLVDEIGGIDKALGYAAGKGGLGKDYAVRVLPAPKTLADMLSGDAQAMVPVGSPAQAALPTGFALLPLEVQRTAVFQVRVARELEKRPVLLIPPAIIHVR